jgi:hypothetical protein
MSGTLTAWATRPQLASRTRHQGPTASRRRWPAARTSASKRTAISKSIQLQRRGGSPLSTRRYSLLGRSMNLGQIDDDHGSLAPDVTDALVSDRGVNDGVRDRAMPHEGLQRPCIDSTSRQGVAGGMPLERLERRVDPPLKASTWKGNFDLFFSRANNRGGARDRADRAGYAGDRPRRRLCRLRSIAGLRFFTLIQNFCWPPRYGRSQGSLSRSN